MHLYHVFSLVYSIKKSTKLNVLYTLFNRFLDLIILKRYISSYLTTFIHAFSSSLFKKNSLIKIGIRNHPSHLFHQLSTLNEFPKYSFVPFSIDIIRSLKFIDSNQIKKWRIFYQFS